VTIPDNVTIPEGWNIPNDLDSSNPYLRIVLVCYSSRPIIRRSTGISVSEQVNRGNVIPAAHRQRATKFADPNHSIFSSAAARANFLLTEQAQLNWSSTLKQPGLIPANPNQLLSNTYYQSEDGSIQHPRLIPFDLNPFSNHKYCQWMMGMVLHQRLIVDMLQCRINRQAFKSKQRLAENSQLAVGEQQLQRTLRSRMATISSTSTSEVTGISGDQIESIISVSELDNVSLFQPVLLEESLSLPCLYISLVCTKDKG
jgi:hypothetical protein